MTQTVMKCYFRKHTAFRPTLHQIDVVTDDYELARSASVSQLRMDGEQWLKPMLVLIQGGKK